jgi:hypothetical protein
MSALGSYVRIRTGDLDRCLALAGAPPDVFSREWTAAVLEEVVFEGSGHLLSSYFLAQTSLNEIEDPFDSPDGVTLAQVFTAAFPARVALALPELDPKALSEFCLDEWGNDASDISAGIASAHTFFKTGMARVGNGEAVVFIIS